MANWIYKKGAAERKDFVVSYISGAKSLEEALAVTKDNIVVIGKGIESMAISANAETEEKRDVLGNNNYDVVGYSETMPVSPLKIRDDDRYAIFIDEAFERRKILDDLACWYLCWKEYKTDENGGKCAWIQKGVPVLGDFADGLNGISTSHDVHFVDERHYGVLAKDLSGFTEETETEDL